MQRRRTWLRRSLATLVGIAAAGGLARAQSFLTTIEAPPLPPAPPRGAWGEVIMANEKWLVVQNQMGQQFPVRADRIAQFLIRWPTDIDNLTVESVVEAVGGTPGSNIIRVDHVDVFEGADQNLVTPTYRAILPNNRPVTAIDPTFQRTMNAWDIGAQLSLYGWVYPISPARVGLGEGLHVVGNAVAVNAPNVQLGVPGNNFVTLTPANGNAITMTQVTQGNPAFAEKGDLAFLVPSGVKPDSVDLRQIVLYKTIPRNRYGR